MKRKWKYGIHASVLTVGVIAIILLLNVFVTVLVDKFPLKLDLTSQKLYEVSENTYEYLRTYDTPTTIYILSASANEDINIKNVLEKYKKANSNIKLENINIKSNPAFGQKYLSDGKQLSANTVIIDGGVKYKVYNQAELYDTSSNILGLNIEQKITSALKYVSNENITKAYFVQGHNEVEMSAGAEALNDENYEISKLMLLNEEIPEDADLLVVFNPSVDFTLSELQKLDAYMAKGGKAQFFFYMSSQGMNNLYDYLKQWGLQINDDAVMENNRQYMVATGNMPMFIADYEESEATKSIAQSKRITAYLPFAKSLNIVFENYNGIEVTKLLKTTESSYTTNDFENMEKTPESKSGACVISAAARNKQTGAVVMVSGTPLLLEQDTEYLKAYGFANSEMYVNMTKFMESNNDGNYIIPSKTLAGDALSMNAIEVLVALIIIAFLPVVSIIIGIVVWFRRRHL